MNDSLDNELVCRLPLGSGPKENVPISPAANSHFSQMPLYLPPSPHPASLSTHHVFPLTFDGGAHGHFASAPAESVQAGVFCSESTLTSTGLNYVQAKEADPFRGTF